MSQFRYLIAGDLKLDLRDQRLYLGDEQLKLGSKAYGVVAALMARPRELVSKDELFETVWPGLAVSESVLTTAIKEARQAFGDDARNPTIIETVHGRGYRFLRDVAATDDLPGSRPPQQPDAERSSTQPAKPGPDAWIAAWAQKPWAAPVAFAVLVIFSLGIAWSYMRSQTTIDPAAILTPAVHPKSIAVLPFDDMSPNGDQQWFAAGLTEELLSALARAPDIRVASRKASERYASPGIDIQAAAAALGVANVLEGSVRRDKDRVRVTAQLIRASDGFHLWSESYDRPASDIIGIQESIAFEIARALKSVMDPERLRGMVKAGTRSVQAYEAFLKARAYANAQARSGDMELTKLEAAELERARTLDPNFARAHWEAAQRWFGFETRLDAKGTPSAEEDARRLAGYLERVRAAMANASTEAERLKYASAAAFANLRINEAKELQLASLKLAPRDVDGWEQLIDLAAYAGDRKLAAHAAERVYTLSIEEGDPRSRAITASVMMGAYESALERARHMTKLLPDSTTLRYQVHRAMLAAGQTAEARRALAPLLNAELPPDNQLHAVIRQACAEGRVKDAMEAYRKLKLLPDPGPSSRWLAAMEVGKLEEANAILKPFDTPARLPRLIQSTIYPYFDVRQFPVLAKHLAVEGIRIPPPVRMPYDCPVTG